MPYHLAAIVFLALILAFIAKIMLGPRRPRVQDRWPLYARPVMSANERDAYTRLQVAVPSYLVLPQVSLGSFIERHHTADYSVRNQYSQLTADFLICDLDSTPRAVIEIDDKSHRHPRAQARDARKNKACESAGIRLLRWPATPLPTTEAMREAVQTALRQTAKP
jgi:very-short-patch-repair endonuclease